MIEHYFGDNLPYYAAFTALVVVCVIAIVVGIRTAKKP
jgi:hypothetical protein